MRAAGADSERRSPEVATSGSSGSTASAATAPFTAGPPVIGGEGERGVATGASPPTSRRRRRGRILTGDTAAAIGADSARRSPVEANFRGSISWSTKAATSSTAGPLDDGEEMVRGVASAAAAAGTAARRPRRRTGGSTSAGGLGDRAGTTCRSSGVTVAAVSATTEALSGGRSSEPAADSPAATETSAESLRSGSTTGASAGSLGGDGVHRSMQPRGWVAAALPLALRVHLAAARRV